MVPHPLAVQLPSHHSSYTCSQSCGGGLRTSKGGRRSIHFGRVAVMHVQGSPKDGGALGPPLVLSTRLLPVPPVHREAETVQSQTNIATRDNSCLICSARLSGGDQL
jgi:hypothetical protein